MTVKFHSEVPVVEPETMEKRGRKEASDRITPRVVANMVRGAGEP